MAVSVSLILSTGTATDGNSHTTASITTTSEPAYACVSIMGATAAPLVPTVVSNGSGGKTWTLVTASSINCSQTWRDNGSNVFATMWLFEGLGAGGSGTVTVTKNAGDSNSTLTGFQEDFAQATGCKTTGAILQAAKSVDLDWDIADTVSATLPNAPTATSRCMAFSCISSTTADVQVPRTNWTQLDDSAVSSPSQGMMFQWRSDAAEQTGSVTQAGGNNAQGGIIVVEIGILTDVTVTTTAAAAATADVGTHILSSTLIGDVGAATAAGGASTSALLAPLTTAAAAAVAAALAPVLSSRITTPNILVNGGSSSNASSYSATLSRALAANTFCLAAISYSRTNPDTPTAPTIVTVSGVTMTLFDDFIYRLLGSDQQAIAVYYGVGSAPSGTSLSISGFGYTASGCSWIVAECPGALTTGTNGVDGIRNQVESVVEDALSAGEELDTLTYASPISVNSRPFLFASMNTSVADSIAPSAADTTWSILADNAHTSPSTEIALLWSETTWDSDVSFVNNGASTWKAGGIAFELVEGLANLVVISVVADAAAVANAATLASTLVADVAAAVADAGVPSAVVTIPLVVSAATADAGVLGGLPLTVVAEVAQAFAQGLPVFIPVVFVPTGRLGNPESLGGNIVLGESGFVAATDITIVVPNAGDATADVGTTDAFLYMAPTGAGAATADAGVPDVYGIIAAAVSAAIADAGIAQALTTLDVGVAAATADGLTVTVIGIDSSGVLYWSDFRIADAPPAAKLHWGALEVPDGANRGLLYFAEFSVVRSASVLYYAELEAPDFTAGDRAAKISWVRFGVPKKRRTDDGPVDRWHREDVHTW